MEGQVSSAAGKPEDPNKEDVWKWREPDGNVRVHSTDSSPAVDSDGIESDSSRIPPHVPDLTHQEHAQVPERKSEEPPLSASEPSPTADSINGAIPPSEPERAHEENPQPPDRKAENFPSAPEGRSEASSKREESEQPPEQKSGDSHAAAPEGRSAESSDVPTMGSKGGFTGIDDVGHQDDPTENDGTRPKRVRRFNEKGLQYQTELSVKKFKGAVRTHNLEVTKCHDILVKTDADIMTLNNCRMTLEATIGEVSDCFYSMVTLDRSKYDVYIDLFKDCERKNLNVLSELTQVIRLSELEMASKITPRHDVIGAQSQVISGRPSSRHSQSCRSSRSSKSGRSEKSGRSSRCSQSSLKSMKAEAAAKAAELKAKLQYLEIESEQKTKLERIATMKKIAVEEARFHAINQVDNDLPDPNSVVLPSIDSHANVSQPGVLGVGASHSDILHTNVSHSDALYANASHSDVSHVNASRSGVSNVSASQSQTESVKHQAKDGSVLLDQNVEASRAIASHVNDPKDHKQNESLQARERSIPSESNIVSRTTASHGDYSHVNVPPLVKQTVVRFSNYDNNFKDSDFVDPVNSVRYPPGIMELNKHKDQNREQVNSVAHEEAKQSENVNFSKLNCNSPEFSPRNSGTSNQVSDLLQSFSDFINVSRLPVPEPGVFTGNPLEFPSWKCAFSTLIERKSINPEEKIHYLKRYLGGKAKECVESYLMIPTADSYYEAMNLIESRFGDTFSVAQAFKAKIESWPKISSKDSQGLRKFSDFLQQCEVARSYNCNLQILDDENHNRIMLSKLPDWLVCRWSRIAYDVRQQTGMYPRFYQFVAFLKREAEIACDAITSHVGKHSVTATTSNEKAVRTCNVVSSETCSFCNKANHVLAECRKLRSKSRDEKSTFIRSKGFCFGCLQQGHLVRNCQGKLKCNICSKKHPTVLHNDEATGTSSVASVPEGKAQKCSSKGNSAGHGSKTNCNQAVSVPSKHVSLYTSDEMSHSSTLVLPVYVFGAKSPSKDKILTYAVLDAQSDTSFISEDLCHKLQVSGPDTHLLLSTMTAESTVVPCRKIEGLKVHGFDSDVEIPLPALYTHDSIPCNESCIPTPSIASNWPYLSRIANSLMPKSDCGVGLLIGYNCSRALVPREVIPPEDSGPFALKCDLGWGIIGPNTPHSAAFNSDKSHSQATRAKVVLRTRARELISPTDILRFFGREESDDFVGTKLSLDDMQFLSIVKDGTFEDEDGHYVIPLPLRNEGKDLHNNKLLAQERLKGLVKRFRRDPEFHKQYSKFMNNLFENGYAEKVPVQELREDVEAYYLPHHGVVNPTKPGKIRIVMDASAKYKGQSLNSNLLTGPDLLNRLIGVLCRFRQETIAFTCDIKEMFYQFRVKPEQRNYLRFLWFENGDFNSSPTVYRSRVHIFGAASSPAVAQYGLKRAAIDGTCDFGQAVSDLINKNFYVDDGLKSVSTAEEAILLIRKGTDLLKAKGLKLHKITSNSRKVIEAVPLEDRTDSVRNLDLSKDPLPIDRALGVQWCIENDSLKFRIVVDSSKCTRRGILQTVCSMYDPLGLIAPVILQGKMILQDMCRDGLGWDDQIPEDLRRRWERWLVELPFLEKLEVPRCFKPLDFGDVKHVELHHFSDACSTGYGQCSFLKLVDTNDKIQCSLVMAKSRVSPLRAISVPRMELTAAVLSTDVSQVLDMELEFDLQHFFWTDSKIVLGFINNDSKRFHVFVANRVQKIRDITTTDQWYHVSTDNNPADVASRGCTGKYLRESGWFVGPQFLKEQAYTETTEETFVLDTNSPEVKKATCRLTSQRDPEKFSWPTKHSSWNKTKRIVAQCLRFVKNVKDKRRQSLTVSDISQAEIKLVLQAQREVFAEEIEALNSSKPQVKLSSRLNKLDPFLDENGVLRVGGRLQVSTLPFELKHPVIMPRTHEITDLIVLHFHEKCGHQGKGFTVNEIRNQGFWILGLSSLVSQTIFKCVTCRKHRGKLQGQKMGNLPADRLEDSPAFTHIAVDCFGPFYIQEGRRELKRFGLLFTCMASRAIHLETLNSMNADSFVNALRRFIAIRGPIRSLRCDRGTNFMGGIKQLQQSLSEVDDQKVREYLMENSCEYLVNVPCSSHQGGVWERLIRSVRSVLNALLSKEGHLVDDEGLRTLLHEAANIVNSRPLTVSSLNDPTSPLPLCPNHLLTMKSSVFVPPPGVFKNADGYSRKRWRRVQHLANTFWERWRKEFVTQLQQRTKWTRQKRNLQVGDLVLVLDDNLPRSQWKVGKVVEVFPSSDGFVRKVRILLGDPTLSSSGKRTKSFSYLERPAHKLVLLLETNEDN